MSEEQHKPIVLNNAIEAIRTIREDARIKRRPKSRIYNKDTVRECQASVFTLEIEAEVMNSEWDGRTKESLLDILDARFKASLWEHMRAAGKK